MSIGESPVSVHMPPQVRLGVARISSSCIRAHLHVRIMRLAPGSSPGLGSQKGDIRVQYAQCIDIHHLRRVYAQVFNVSESAYYQQHFQWGVGSSVQSCIAFFHRAFRRV